jgi:HK97 family phage prohead protease
MTETKENQAVGLVLKTVARDDTGGNGAEFVLSDASPDRMGDIIEQDGWSLANFRKNPIALFGHDTGFVVGQWRNVRVVDNELRGVLDLMPPVSERQREIAAAVDAGVLRATSVGFRPTKAEPIDPDKPFMGGTRFLKQELVEVSLVAVGANANALQIAKSLNLSDATLNLIFGKYAAKDQDDDATATGKYAETKTLPKRKQTQMSISEKVEAQQQRVNAATDALSNFVNKVGEVFAGDDTKTMDKLADDLAVEKSSLASLQKAEQLLGTVGAVVTASPVAMPSVIGSRPWTKPAAKKLEPVDYYWRVAAVLSLARLKQVSADVILNERFRDDEGTKAMLDYIVLKGATVPATTTLAGWAAELAQTGFGPFLDQLTAQSVYQPLSSRGPKFTFGRNAIISIPSRSATPTLAGSFIAQGAPIPVRQAAFTAQTLTPKKMGVITTMTREIDQHSTPDLQGIVRGAMQYDTAGVIDSVLLGTGAADTTTPAGIRNGVAATTATTGAGFAALVGDISNLIGVLSDANGLESPVWLMHPTDAARAGLTQNAGGDFPFRNELNAGTLNGYPVIKSTRITKKMVILVDAAAFFSATGDVANFSVSDQATLHMEDTAPLPISATGSPNVVAAPVRSLWQTDSLGIRMLLDINWAMVRPGLVAWTQAVTW